MIEYLSILIILDDHTTALVNYTNNAKCIGFSKEIFQNLPKQLQLVSGVCYRIIWVIFLGYFNSSMKNEKFYSDKQKLYYVKLEYYMAYKDYAERPNTW